MTYADIESSIDSGNPVELFRFVHGSDVWGYSAGDIEVVHGGETYYPIPTNRDGGIEITSEINKTEITVLAPVACEVSQLLLVGMPEHIISLTVFRVHADSGFYETSWKGRVVSADWKDNQAELSCESIFSGMKRPGLRAKYQRICRHALYTDACGVDKDEYAVECTVTAIDASLLNITFSPVVPASFSDGWFSAGMAAVGGAYRFILGHGSSVVSLSSPFSGLSVGDSITLYPGCDHSRATCNDKFDNILNNGGFAWIPTDDPYSGSVV